MRKPSNSPHLRIWQHRRPVGRPDPGPFSVEPTRPACFGGGRCHCYADALQLARELVLAYGQPYEIYVGWGPGREWVRLVEPGEVTKPNNPA